MWVCYIFLKKARLGCGKQKSQSLKAEKNLSLDLPISLQDITIRSYRLFILALQELMDKLGGGVYFELLASELSVAEVVDAGVAFGEQDLCPHRLHLFQPSPGHGN